MTSAFDRLTKGQKTYGSFRPETDGRDLYREAEEKLLNAIVYLYFLVLRLRAVERHLPPGGGR